MTTVRNNGFYMAGPDHERDAAIETLRQLLQQTEELASDADLTEVAFFIGVALASLKQEKPSGIDLEAVFGTTNRIM